MNSFSSSIPGMGGPPDLSLVELAMYAGIIKLGLIVVLAFLACISLIVFFIALILMEVGLRVLQNAPDPIGKFSKLGGLVFRSLRRNLLRTALTYVALFILTGILTFIYGIVNFLGQLTADTDKEQLVILTEKFAVPSQMPPGYGNQLKGVIENKLPAEYRPNLEKNYMTWSFVGASLDPTKFTQENNLFLFALDPDAISNGMMKEQGLSKEDLGEDTWNDLLKVLAVVKEDKRNVVIGEDRLKIMNKKVGDEVKFYSTNYKELEFECRIVGAFPSGSRLGTGAAMRYDYLLAKLDDYKARKGTDHPVANRCLNVVWLRMPDKQSYEALAEIVNQPGTFASPAVKMETFSAFATSVLEPFKPIFWGMKWIIMPSIVAIMCLVIGITIAIGVRERWSEMAVLKVLGFQPWQVMGMIISEAVLIGVYGGLLSTWSVYFLPIFIRWTTRKLGIKFGFFDNFDMPMEIVFYGPMLGIIVGLVGAALPSWSARKVKVSEVFSQVA
jgi:putative ABC transport system permease protein